MYEALDDLKRDQKDFVISFRCTKKLKKELEELAKTQGIKVNSLAPRLVELGLKYLKEKKAKK